MTIKIVQFNVLSSAMLKYLKMEVTNEQRLQVLVKQITHFISQRVIFCLQECGYTEMALIHPLFAMNGYYAVCSHYSTKPERDGFGVVIAFPIADYEMLDYGRTEPKMRIIQPLNVPEEEFTKAVGERNSPSSKSSPDNLYKECSTYDNTLLWVKLKEKTNTAGPFLVYCWHMPCKFYWPAIMTLFAEALLKSLDSTTPFILATDLNLQPHSPQYKYLTGEQIEFQMIDRPYSSWNVETPPLRLIDTKRQYKEGEFTNYCHFPDGGEFIGILDYIFTSPQLIVKPIVEKEYPKEHQPSAYNGSDHFPIYRELEL